MPHHNLVELGDPFCMEKGCGLEADVMCQGCGGYFCAKHGDRHAENFKG